LSYIAPTTVSSVARNAPLVEAASMMLLIEAKSAMVSEGG
jgi:hypothetical protein